MTLDLAENVPIHILKLNYSKPSKLTLKTRPKKLIYTSGQNRDKRAKTLALGGCLHGN